MSGRKSDYAMAIDGVCSSLTQAQGNIRVGDNQVANLQVQVALVHATVAAAEQLRIANLIAWNGMRPVRTMPEVIDAALDVTFETFA